MPETADTGARRLMLLRHGKSAWPDGIADFDRPIAERGREAVPRIGAYMRRENLLPDLALVSTARRTQDSWQLLQPQLPDGIDTRDVGAIYEAPASRILAAIAATDAEKRCLLVVGHNPGLQELALALAGPAGGKGDDEALLRLAGKFPTSALAVIDFAAPDWKLAAGSGRLERFVTPRSID